MSKKIGSIALFVVIIAVIAIGSCKKDNSSAPLEPISLVAPDSASSTHFIGDSVPLQIKFTTDRPINYVIGTYAIDTTGLAINAPQLYPDTLFYLRLDSLNPRVNLYTYTGSYRIPDSLPSFSIIYFKASFTAGNAGFVTGQNYPPGIVADDKYFKINVR